MIEESDDLNICSECIGNSDFSQWINENGDKGICNFDSSHAHSNKVLKVTEFAKHVDEYFRNNYRLSECRPDINDDSDNRYICDGETYEFILQNDLLCDEQVLEAIIENLPDADFIDIQDGATSFYVDDENYERIPDEDESYYYEIDAVVDNRNTPLENLKKSLTLLSKLLDEKQYFQIELQKFQFMMIYSFCITSLESYLSDTFVKQVLGDQKLKKEYLNSEASFKEKKIFLSKIFDEYSSIDSLIKNQLQDTTFHNLIRAKKLYQDVLKIDIGNIENLIQLINKRHDFVHRGGKNKNGKSVSTNKEEIIQMITDIKNICSSIESSLTK